MWKHLLELYRESKLNAAEPACLFAETQSFNEGWLLRSVLREWKTSSRRSDFPFFRFPPNAKVYSEGQLRTPFKARFRGDPQAEAHTHVDGIAGDFSIRDGTKSGLELDPGCRYIAVFEAKLYSPVGKGTRRAKGYDQISRTTACLSHAMLQAASRQICEAHIVVLYPEDNLDIKPEELTRPEIKNRIEKRLADYKSAAISTDELLQFEYRWKEMFEQVEVHFRTWEDVLAEIGDESLWEFYKLCRKFNG